jgi:potassium-transporting ATPase potassium-binding subunit
MTENGWFQIAIYCIALIAITKPMGVYIARVFAHEYTFMDRVCRPLERLTYRLTFVDPNREMRWTEYSIALLVFSAVTLVVTYGMQRVQAWLPFNPQQLANVVPHSAFNTAVSFTTNTNWQSYVPETTMSYLTQMAGLAYHNFISAAVGIAIAIALVRGIAQREKDTIGNFWVDITRCTLWILLPMCLIGALVLVSMGVVQNLRSYDKATLLEPQKMDAKGNKSVQTVTEQVIAQGPVASQEIIKELGTNGGGFFNTNSAHPYENPTPLSNFFEMLMIFAIPSGLTYTLGRMTGSQRHGWAVFGAMAVLFLAGVTAAYWAESRGNPLLKGVDQTASASHPGGNMEGKEVRFGIANSVLFATITTDASCGAVNSMHDSYTPLGGMVPLVNILLGEVIFGGVGAGLYGMLIFVILTVFIAGLMVGRTPEYLGKKIEAFEVKMAMLAVLILPMMILGFAAVSVVSPTFGTSALSNAGPHGLSQILYAFTSGAGNNGSAFAGISANTPWYNTTIGLAMLFGRFFVIIPALAIAGSLGSKKYVPPSSGTFPVTTPLFVVLLLSVVLIIGALTYFPALSLGPILEHLVMSAGKTF